MGFWRNLLEDPPDHDCDPIVSAEERESNEIRRICEAIPSQDVDGFIEVTKRLSKFFRKAKAEKLLHSNSRTLNEMMGTKLLIEKMAILSRYPHAQSEAMKFLVNIIFVDPNDNTRHLLLQNGLMEVVTSSMEVFQAHYATQTYGCALLWNLSLGSNDIRLRCVSKGAVKSVIEAMKAFPQDSDVNIRACGTLRAFVRNIRAETLEAMEKVDGAATLLKVSARHHHNKRIRFLTEEILRECFEGDSVFA